MILPGARLALDYGDKRIGVAKSDDSRLIASPLITLNNGESTDSAVIAIKAVSYTHLTLPTKRIV